MQSPRLAPRARSISWDVRWGAARALGYIGYEDGAQPLIAALDNQDDWRLVFAAAESLGRLRAKAAIPRLREVAKNHWFPFVRKTARTALRSIDGENEYEPKMRTAFEYFAYEAGDYDDPNRIHPMAYDQKVVLLRGIDEMSLVEEKTAMSSR